MTFLEMKISGITMDYQSIFPMIILKHPETATRFPLQITDREREAIVSAIVDKKNIYSGIIRQLVRQQGMSVERISLSENENGDLLSKVFLRQDDSLASVKLYPVEGILLAIEFDLDVHVDEVLLEREDYYRRKASEGEILSGIMRGGPESLSFGLSDSGFKKKKTVQ